MNLNLIECFYAVAKASSLSKVATDMEIEQSTLTRYINRLEASIGVRLFHRSGRGMTPEQFNALVADEVKLWGEAIRKGNIMTN